MEKFNKLNKLLNNEDVEYPSDPRIPDNFAFANNIKSTLQNTIGVTGANFDEQLHDLIPRVSIYRMGVAGYWGLTSSDWEIDS